MLLPRIIPCLLIRSGGLVKTQQFAQAKYVGDPLNAVRIFNEKEVDELIVLDIDATAEGRDPDYDLIRRMAAECRMPLCYGGGVRSVDQIARIVGLGVEKVAMSAAAIDRPEVIREAAAVVGSQSIVAVVDVRRSGRSGEYEVWSRNGTKRTGQGPAELAHLFESMGVGEIVVNSIDLDGQMTGYDLALAQVMRSAVRVPLTMLGGAGSVDHLADLVRAVGVVGAAAGSLFVFKGVYRAVLISYPSAAEKDRIGVAAAAPMAQAESAPAAETPKRRGIFR